MKICYVGIEYCSGAGYCRIEFVICMNMNIRFQTSQYLIILPSKRVLDQLSQLYWFGPRKNQSSSRSFLIWSLPVIPMTPHEINLFQIKQQSIRVYSLSKWLKNSSIDDRVLSGHCPPVPRTTLRMRVSVLPITESSHWPYVYIHPSIKVWSIFLFRVIGWQV